MSDTPAYGLWSLVIINSLIFIVSYCQLYSGAGRIISSSSSWNGCIRHRRTASWQLPDHMPMLRHPQYDAFTLVMMGFLFQLPTILTLVMFPVLVLRYKRLARNEEQETLEIFGEDYSQYMAKVPAFIPETG